jgi:hypothetical protein
MSRVVHSGIKMLLVPSIITERLSYGPEVAPCNESSMGARRLDRWSPPTPSHSIDAALSPSTNFSHRGEGGRRRRRERDEGRGRNKFQP